jgi:hypothetical protein
MADQSTPEPVMIAEGVRTILAAVVAAGWIVIPDVTINAIVSVVALAISVIGSWMARKRVTPTQ